MLKRGTRRSLAAAVVVVAGAVRLAQVRVEALAQARPAVPAPRQSTEAVPPSFWSVPVQTFGPLLPFDICIFRAA